MLMRRGRMSRARHGRARVSDCRGRHRDAFCSFFLNSTAVSSQPAAQLKGGKLRSSCVETWMSSVVDTFPCASFHCTCIIITASVEASTDGGSSQA